MPNPPGRLEAMGGMAGTASEEKNMKPLYMSLDETKNNSPSRRDGLSEEMEERWRVSAISLIITAGGMLAM